MCGINFDCMPCIYWSNKAKISYLQRLVIVHSIIYYELNESVITDKRYDSISYQLLNLCKEDNQAFKQSDYYYVMHDFDANTGFDIISRLTESDKSYLLHIASNVLRLNKGK